MWKGVLFCKILTSWDLSPAVLTNRLVDLSFANGWGSAVIVTDPFPCPESGLTVIKFFFHVLSF